MDDLISKRAAIDALCRRCDLAADDDEPCTDKCNDIKILEKLPSVQPEPEIHWGYTPTYERPLGDVEIVPRLRDIQKQIPGGSYAIDRAIEIIEAVASAQPEPYNVNVEGK